MKGKDKWLWIIGGLMLLYFVYYQGATNYANSVAPSNLANSASAVSSGIF